MTKRSSYDMRPVLELCLQIIVEIKKERADKGENNVKEKGENK